jgi:phytoene dehydrogenase-like protein
MEKKIVIIGAGIAGLSAGCYARMNGYEAEIYEMHALPGGLCTSWKKGDYTIDGCLHWLTGSAPPDSFYKLWKELGAVQNRKFYNHEEFYRITGSGGKTFIAYCDIDRFEQHMKELSPGDAEPIEFFCNLVRKFATFRAPLEVIEMLNVFGAIKLIWKTKSYLRDLDFFCGISIEEFATRFKDPFLREVFPMVIDSKEMSLFGLVITMAQLHNKCGGFPEGGSLEFAKAIEKRLLNLGGVIHYGKKVEKVLVKDNKACGIKLEKGEEIMADHVISCADLHHTVYKMLDGKYIEPQHEKLFRTAKPYHSSIQVSFGVKMDLTKKPDCIAELYKLQSPILIGNQEYEWFPVCNYSFDPTLAPKGKTVVVSSFPTDDFEYWEKLYADRPAYKAEKERIIKVVSGELEKKYPGFIDCIEVTDVLSPMTYVRYAGNYRGSYMSWIMTPSVMKHNRSVKKTLKGLDNFWLSGMWLMPPGGVPAGAKTSRDVLQFICRKDKKKFRVTEE